MNLFLDTNIWLRFFIGDEEKQLKIVKQILELSEESKIKLATSTFILSEFVFVETSFYKISKKDIIKDLNTITAIRNILLIEKTDFNESLQYYKESTSKMQKWSDCVIAAQVPQRFKLCSFDERLEKLIGKDRFIHPAKAVKKFPKL